MKYVNRVLFLATVSFMFSVSIFAQKKDVLFSFCNFELPEELVQRNISFSESFAFTIGEKGNPENLKRVLGKYVTDDQVLQCIADWRFVGFSKGSRATVLFSWKHGICWKNTQVSSKGLYRVALNRQDTSLIN